MCYKQEKQEKYAAKLQERFDELQVPFFLQDAFFNIASMQARCNYFATLKEMLDWLLDNGYIKHSISAITQEDMNSIRPVRIDEYFRYQLNKKGISLSTLDTKRKQLSSIWTILQEEHHVQDNVVQKVRSAEFRNVKTNRQKMRKMPLHHNMEAMYERIDGRKGDPFYKIRAMSIIRVLRGTGLRESELVGLDINDLYLTRERMDQNEPRPYLLVISKGVYRYDDEGKDIVYLTNDAIAAFNEWLEIRSTMNIDTEAVFINRNGNRMTEDNIQKLLRTYSKGTITPHMLRHEYTTVLQEETGDATFVQEQGRWRSSNIMRSVYDSGASRSVHVLDNM